MVSFPVRKQKHQVYHRVSNSGGSRRTKVETGEWSWSLSVRVRDPKQIKKRELPPELLFTCKSAQPFDDLLWPDVMLFVVSDRLRAFFEKEAPGVAEYFPAKIVGPGAEKCPHGYWMMHFLHAIDCLDRELSMNTDADGKEFVEVPVIDGARAGPNEVIGLLKGYEVCTIIRDDLRKKIKKEGFKGPQFTPLAQSSVGMTWNKPDHSSKGD